MKLSMERLTPIAMTILDTAFWVALMKSDDSNHELAKKIAKRICHDELDVYDHTYIETLTVLRNKVSELACSQFINFFKDLKINILISNEKILSLATIFFIQFKKLSFTDCMIIASAKLTGAQIFTFDKYLQKTWEYIDK